MASVKVTFTFHSGVKRTLFHNVRLSGSWDATGKFSSLWTQTPMLPSQDGTGCDAFSVTVALDATQVGTTFQWGVFADLPGAPNSWVVVTEVHDPNSSQTTRSFVLAAAASQQDYWFATGRRFGAQKYTPPAAANPGIRFAVWAPYAQKVEVVFAPAARYTHRLRRRRRHRNRPIRSGDPHDPDCGNRHLADRPGDDARARRLQRLHEPSIHVPGPE